MMSMNKSYHEMILLPTLEERLKYLALPGIVGEDTFGNHRYLNQRFYHQDRWKRKKRDIILRDGGCELGVPGYYISGAIYVHHITPVTIDDIINDCSIVWDDDNLISCSFYIHSAIHYKRSKIMNTDTLPRIRCKNDMIPWR